MVFVITNACGSAVFPVVAAVLGVLCRSDDFVFDSDDCARTAVGQNVTQAYRIEPSGEVRTVPYSGERGVKVSSLCLQRQPAMAALGVTTTPEPGIDSYGIVAFVFAGLAVASFVGVFVCAVIKPSLFR